MTTETTQKTAYELACEKLGRIPATIENYSHLPEKQAKCEFGLHKKNTCIEAANLDADGKPYEPDFTDDTWKYFQWYRAIKDDKRPSGVGFVFCGTDRDFDLSGLGSRLGYSRNSAIAREIGNNPEITEYHNEAMGV